MNSLALFLALTLQAVPAPADSCANGRISAVVVRNHSIFGDADTASTSRLGWAYRAANSLHIRTRESVIRREILFAEGDCFDAYRLSESERLLREFEGLSRVSITDTPLPDGKHSVLVDTRDEWTTRVDARLSAHGWGLRIAEDNLVGTGQSLGVFYVKHDVTRDVGIAWYSPQLLGTRWDLRASVANTGAGTAIYEEVSYPWVAEVSHWGSVQTFLRDDRFFDYVARDTKALDAPHILLPVREKAFDLAVIRRFGPPGNTAMLGAALGYRQLSYPGSPQNAPDGDFDARFPADTADRAAIAHQLAPRDNIRAYAVFGHRTVQWVRRRAMDSMRGQEDVRLGAELGLALGRSFPSIERDNDIYATMSLYTGFELGPAMLFARLRADGRRDLDALATEPEWQDFYGDAELLGYIRPGGDNTRHTLFLRAAGISAWNTRTPFQVTLGGEQSVRGFDRERFPGGRRVVFNAEDRMYFGWPFPRAFDFGGTVFFDTGMIEPGDVPYGMRSGWRSSVGAGIRTAFPAGSRTVYRIDFAWPLTQGTQLRDFRLQLSLGEPLGLRPRAADEQITRSRPQSAAGQLFPLSR